MDQAKAIEVLEWWVEHATAARERGSSDPGGLYTFAWTHKPEVAELRAREDQTRRVLHGALGLNKLPVIMDSGSSAKTVSLAEGVELCRYALGRIRTDAATREIVGSTAPTMAADSLHSTVWGAASGRWDSGHYSDAVQRAATFLNAEIQDRVGRHDVSDKELMQEAFSSAAPVAGKARLRWPGDDNDLTVKAMRVGILNFAQGVFSAIRNPATHSTADMDRQEALEQLAALSMLARWIDRCEVESA